MLQDNKLEIVSKNIDQLENASISYKFIADGDNTIINAEMYIPRANFTPEAGQNSQLVIKDVTFIIKLTEDAIEEYGEQAEYFQNAELKFDVQTARPTGIELSVNTCTVTSLEDTSKQVYRVKYLSNQGEWVVDAIDNEGNKIANTNDTLTIYTDFLPVETVNSSVTIESSDERLLKINTDSESITADELLTEKLRQENTIGEYTFAYKNIINFINVSQEDYINADTIDNYKYIGEVTLKFTSTDTTFCTDPNNSALGVYAEITFQIVVAAEDIE